MASNVIDFERYRLRAERARYLEQLYMACQSMLSVMKRSTSHAEIIGSFAEVRRLLEIIEKLPTPDSSIVN
jgi:hypothetical protein